MFLTHQSKKWFVKCKENIGCPPICTKSIPISKSYIFQEIEREFCFLDDEKYYLVNILSQCTHGQRLDWSFEAPAVLLLTGDTRHRAPENYRVNAHWDLKQEIFADCLWLMLHYSLTSEKSPIKATSTVSRMKYSCCFSLSIILVTSLNSRHRHHIFKIEYSIAHVSAMAVSSTHVHWTYLVDNFCGSLMSLKNV